MLIRELAMYFILCFSAGFFGSFGMALCLYKENDIIKKYWRLYIGSGMFSMMLSKFISLVVTVFVPALTIEPPYPVGVLLGVIIAYFSINQTERKRIGLFNVVRMVLRKYGYKLDRIDDNEK